MAEVEFRKKKLFKFDDIYNLVLITEQFKKVLIAVILSFFEPNSFMHMLKLSISYRQSIKLLLGPSKSVVGVDWSVYGL